MKSHQNITCVLHPIAHPVDLSHGQKDLVHIELGGSGCFWATGEPSLFKQGESKWHDNQELFELMVVLFNLFGHWHE